MKPKKKRIALFEEPEDSSLRKGPETPSLDTLPPIQPSSSHNTANGKQTLSAMPLVKQDPAEHLSLARGAVSGLTKVIKRAKNRQDAAADGAVQKAKSKSKKKDGLTIKGHGSKDSEPTEDSIAQQSLSLNLAPPRKRAQRETVASPSHLEPFLISDDSEDWVASTESDSDDEEDNDLIQEDVTQMTTVEDLLQLAFQSSSEGSDASQASDVVILKADLPDDEEASKPKQKKKAKKKKAKEEAEVLEVVNSDEETWKVLEERAEMEEAYVPKVLPEMEPPKQLLLPLLPYQKGFLGWAVNQEKGDIKGGILADEMGMGKTIQAISLVVTHRTDDNSTLSTIGTAPEQKTGPAEKQKRPRLGLMNAPPKPSPNQNASGLEPTLDLVTAKKALEVSAQEAAEKEASNPVSPQNLPGQGLGMGVEERPSALKVMAVGESCCGNNKQTASGPSGQFCRATLVICPVVAVIQWRQEIARYIEPGFLKVVVYHGNKRATSAKELEEADVVLTTYSIAEGEFRRHTQPVKATCSYCQKKFYPDRLKVHLRFFCGPNAKKSDALAKQQKKRPRAQDMAEQESEESESSTSDDDDEAAKKKPKKAASSKILSKKEAASGKKKPASAVSNKQGAIKNKSKSNAKPPAKRSKASATKKNSKGKKRKGKDDSDEDDSDFSLDEESSEDEAEEGGSVKSSAVGHMKPKKVKNEVGWQARAAEEAQEMIARAQETNKRTVVGESILHKLIASKTEDHLLHEQFLPWNPDTSGLCQELPFSGKSRSKKAKKPVTKDPCSCKSLDYSFKTNWRKCDHCGHSPLSHYCYWNKWVANPIKNYGYVGKGRSAMTLLKGEILEKILLRRTKIQCADVLALPPRTVVLRKDKFDEREEDFYEALYTQSQAQFDSYVQTSTVLNNYAHVFSLLVRLRQAVNHPYLVVHSASAPPGASEGGGMQEVGCCNICHDPLEDGVAAHCGHAFCRVCLVDYLESATGGPLCLACKKPLTIDLANAAKVTASRVSGSNKNSIINRVSLAAFQSSTKIEALREEIDLMLRNDPSGKAIVFSQFTSMLDLIHFRLQQVGIKCVKLMGSMEMKQRDAMIEAFSTDPTVKVFLMSLKAGGVALNLTAASHVMLMDPWWNPAVEQQAQDRIHRLGQYKPIHVTRFVIGGTIEERILKLQDKKQLVFEGTVGRDSEALGRLTEDDLRFLFG